MRRPTIPELLVLTLALAACARGGSPASASAAEPPPLVTPEAVVPAAPTLHPA